MQKFQGKCTKRGKTTERHLRPVFLKIMYPKKYTQRQSEIIHRICVPSNLIGGDKNRFG